MARVRLHSLRLSGFKSFPDEVRLEFPGLITAIVGPNGCGKSNLVDAMLWVLGEQSPSLLRLKNMGDVVFSGAAGRKPAGTAEVGLTMQSSDARWAEHEGRLEIRRRVLRSGPSDYRLNGRATRLRDIADELSAVGLGTRGYSIIEQGRVGQVLSARPTDRRVLLEEAAGITRYKARRREAELKLEHTRQNLLRLDDVITEVTKNLRQLKRQARQAERHQAITTELREALTVVRTVEVRELQERRDDLTRQRGVAQNELAAAASALGGADADLASARRELDAAREEAEVAREEVGALESANERLAAFLERSADLMDTLRSAIDQNRADTESMEQSRSAAVENLARARSDLAAADAAAERVRSDLETASVEEAAARAARDEREQAAARTRSDLLRTISSLTTSRNQLGELERERDRLAYVATQLEQEHGRLDGRRVQVAERHDAVAESAETARGAVAALKGRRHDLVARRDELRDLSQRLKGEADAFLHDAWEMRHQLAGVERDLARHAAATERLLEILPEESLVGQVSDFVRPSPNTADALDRLWRDWLEAPVVRSDAVEASGRRDLAALRERVRLVVAEPTATRCEWPEIPGCESLRAAAGLDADAEHWLLATLPPAYRCDDADLARRRAAEHPGVAILDAAGTVWWGRSLEPRTEADKVRGALRLRRDREALESRIAATSQQAEERSERHGAIATELADVEQELTDTDRQVVEAEQAQARATAEENSIAEERTRLEKELDALARERERTEERRVDLSRRQEQVHEDVTALESRSQDLERTLEEANAAVDEHRGSAAEALRRLDHWRAEQRLADERRQSAARDVERIEGEAKLAEGRLSTLAKHREEHRSELASTEAEVIRSRTRLVEQQGAAASARDRVRACVEKVQALQQRVTGLEREVADRRQVHDRARESLHRVEMDQGAAESEWEHLREACVREIGRSPEALLSGDVAEDVNVEALRERITAMQASLDRMGPVNLLALQESAELEERSGFLGDQRRDLVDSLKSLDGTIAEIDATCTERFVETYQQVNAVFAETFAHLFGGGAARLDLVDEDDPLESGVDITAQPPGKKNQSVQLLSGGEKALTALALLIALFRIKPSPFCILDEVDAPLDDANVARLGELVQSMTDHTQFVLITHNRRTMQRADVLYGVTMEEPGVSKLVSVRLEDAAAMVDD
jgi:chromosome segregation protein